MSKPTKELYDWQEFTKKSDEKYRKVQECGDYSGLEKHNILSKTDFEMNFMREYSRKFFGIELMGKALDVCCGIGYMSESLRNKGFEVSGLELNHDAVDVATKKYPEINFVQGDAVTPEKYFDGEKFNLIYIREAHPFSRVCDADMQIPLVEKYLGLLNEKGVLVIAHATKGGGMSCRSVDFKLLEQLASDVGGGFSGPHNIFFLKHLRLPVNKFNLAVTSTLSQIVQEVTNFRWIEYVFLCKR